MRARCRTHGSATHSFKEAHFATFPPALVEPCIKAGTSERGVCGECGAPWVREVKSRGWQEWRRTGRGASQVGEMTAMECATTTGSPTCAIAKRVEKTTGWSPTCDHDACYDVSYPIIPATVLDPFGGSGTVGLVADRLQRSAILIEISPEYAEMARRRIDDDAPLLAAAE